ncbi:small kinetochore-associated protein [Otolemur garnettii]|uniref:small kinetochore-associated protein n=1 Tax=Otolemur garnettii TaxID=30611 RepID=UPI0002740DE4|nr:small kinetochore-associated protein [Otolemur garnettii]
MAAPKAAAQDKVFRTAGLLKKGDPRPLPPSYRKFPFETEAVDLAGCVPVAAECLLSKGDEDYKQEELAPGAQPCCPVTMTSVDKTVYCLQAPSMPSDSLPADTQTQGTSKKSLLPVRSKEVLVSKHLHSGGLENDVAKITKSRRENRQMKVADTANRRNVKKGFKPPCKQKSEEELKDKNQVLEAINKQLHQKLTETQGELKDLTQKVELLEKFQDNCLAILESKGLIPALDSETLASQQEATTDHTDSMLLLETLKDELKLFNETAKKQMEELQALKVKLKMKEEERAQFLEQRPLFNCQLNDFTATIKEMEQLLEM